jgi:hypothetical protein
MRALLAPEGAPLGRPRPFVDVVGGLVRLKIVSSQVCLPMCSFRRVMSYVG